MADSLYNDLSPPDLSTLSLHDALPISRSPRARCGRSICPPDEWPSPMSKRDRSEEHTSELQSPCNLVCRLLLEKKKELTLINHKPSGQRSKTMPLKRVCSMIQRRQNVS